MSRPRDLLGYGDQRPTVVWPNGARVAVSLVVNFEEGAEFAISDGDAANERFGEVLSVVPEGRRDFGQEELFAYGMRAGLWRFLDAFEHSKRRVTFFMCGRAVERLPGLARAVVDHGHEPACHGWLWRPHADYTDVASERADLERCISTMQSVTGERPLGFFCRGSQSLETRALLAELGFLYDSNALDDDVPYFDETPSGRLLVLPYAFDSNDMKFFHPNGFVEPASFVRYVRSALDVLVEEGRRGKTSLFNVGLHLRICGRPGRFAAVLGILAALDEYGDDVFVARRIDIARHWLVTSETGRKP